MQPRTPLFILFILFILPLLVAPAMARASALPGGPPFSSLPSVNSCQAASARAEAQLRVPDGFLSAIARVESGRPDPSTGLVSAWPWTVNAEGQGSFYATKEQAVAAVRALQQAGVRSIDVGCLQVNLMHHPEAFSSLEDAFDPDTNARFAASFLVSLFGQTGSWPHAAAAYHSQTPTLGADYQKKVLAAWALPAVAPATGAAGPASKSDPPLPTVQMPVPAWGGHAITAFLPAVHAPGKPAFAQAGRDLAAYRIVPVPLAWRPAAQLRRRTG